MEKPTTQKQPKKEKQKRWVSLIHQLKNIEMTSVSTVRIKEVKPHRRKK